MSAELYAGLEDYFEDEERFEQSSETFRAVVQDYIDENGIDETDYYARLQGTHLHFLHGAIHSCLPHDETLADLAFGLELGERPSTLRVNTEDEEIFFAARSVVMIDMPLPAYLRGEKERRAADGLEG